MTSAAARTIEEMPVLAQLLCSRPDDDNWHLDDPPCSEEQGRGLPAARSVAGEREGEATAPHDEH